MYYQECENLADERSSLREVIQKVDNLIHSSGSDIIDPNIIANIIGENDSQVTGIFDQLVKKGLLYKVEKVECPKTTCKNHLGIKSYVKAVENEDPFVCSNCGLDLIKNTPKKTEEYRLNPLKMHKKIKEVQKIIDVQKVSNFDQKLPDTLIDDLFINADLLRYFSKNPDWLRNKPFEGKKIFFVLHFLRDLIPFVKACQELGLAMNNAYFFYKEYPYPQKEAVKKWLEDEGAVVLPRSKIFSTLEAVSKIPSEDLGEILIVEDGGFIAPAIHNDFPKLIPFTIGAVEQTTRGIYNADEIQNLEFPIISVAKSRLKGDFEPKYIAEAVVNNIKRLMPDFSFKGKSVVVFGFGTIGKEVAEWLKSNGSVVEISEIDPHNQLLAHESGFEVSKSPQQAVMNKKLVVGTSGRESINSDVIPSLAHGTFLVSASSELYEIDMRELNRLQRDKKDLITKDDEVTGSTFVLPPDNREIHVLANGYPINFWGFESMPGEASDLIMTLILLSTVELASGNYSEKIINSEAVNEIAEKHNVAKKFRDIQGN